MKKRVMISIVFMSLMSGALQASGRKSALTSVTAIITESMQQETGDPKRINSSLESRKRRSSDQRQV